MIEFGTDSIEARFDVSKAFTPGELGERNGEELVEAGQFPDAVIPLIPVDAEIELVTRDEIEKLGEDDPALVHKFAPGIEGAGSIAESALEIQIEKTSKGT
jgi:hypothetical protein